jgi:hypothetical protein
VGVPKSPKLGLSQFWSPITLRADLVSRCNLKQSCSPCRELLNGMLHAIYRQVNRVDSWLFLVRSQTSNLTLGPSFGHTLCFRCPNEQWKPILNIYVSRAFQWYKECHKPLSFDPWNCSLKFQESQSRSCLGSVRVHSLTLSYTPGSMWCDSRAFFWPTPLQPLCLGREPKTKVAKIRKPLNAMTNGLIVVDIKDSWMEIEWI